eukprot:COSAG02_NODE_308_length_25072_cov_20.906925_19_plen_362_part_00
MDQAAIDKLISNAIGDDNDPPAVGRYLGADGDPNCKDRYGCPALVAAAECGRTDITKMLVDADASLELRDSDGCTALMAAAIWGHLEIVQYLLRAGSDPLATCNKGKSAKQYAEDPCAWDEDDPIEKTQAHDQIAAVLAAAEKKVAAEKAAAEKKAAGEKKAAAEKAAAEKAAAEQAADEQAAAEQAAAQKAAAEQVEEAEPPEVDAWLAMFDAAALRPDLDALGAESVEDLKLLDAGDLKALEAKAYEKLKKLKAKKLVTALAALASTPPAAAAPAEMEPEPEPDLEPPPAAGAGNASLVVFGARCIEFDESDSDLLGPVSGIFDDETNPSVSIDKALKGKRLTPVAALCTSICRRCWPG